MDRIYVHGYTQREAERLDDQAGCLSELLHHDSVFPEGSLILEAGCGVGSQTKIIALKNPRSKFISIDISTDSVRKARDMAEKSGIKNAEFREGDIFNLDFKEAIFDHVFICFVLEHLKDPGAALRSVKRVLKPGGSVMVIEGDHGSAFFYPDSAFARKAIEAQIKLQEMGGGNALIGRELYPLLLASGFKGCVVEPRTVYADSGRPGMVEGFTKSTFTAMIEGIKDSSGSVIDPADFDRGVRDLYRTSEKDGVFCYTFFKGTGIK
jgi:SAM-dependent methyltransferase